MSKRHVRFFQYSQQSNNKMDYVSIHSGKINVVEETFSDLWHWRLGHLSEKGLDALSRHNLLLLEGMHLIPCTHYLHSKQHKILFHKLSSHRRSYVLDLIHIDVCSMTINTLGGILYFVIFINDHSRKL